MYLVFLPSEDQVPVFPLVLRREHFCFGLLLPIKIKTARGNGEAPLTLNAPCLTLSPRTSVFLFAIAARSRVFRSVIMRSKWGVWVEVKL